MNIREHDFDQDPPSADTQAGEYVLGVLNAGERRAAEAKIVADPAFARLVDGWERRLAPLAIPDCPFDPPPEAAHRRGAHWVRPEVVVEIAYGELTSDGRIRHPVYLGERPDVDPSAVVRPDRQV